MADLKIFSDLIPFSFLDICNWAKLQFSSNYSQGVETIGLISMITLTFSIRYALLFFSPVFTLQQVNRYFIASVLYSISLNSFETIFHFQLFSILFNITSWSKMLKLYLLKLRRRILTIFNKRISEFTWIFFKSVCYFLETLE